MKRKMERVKQMAIGGKDANSISIGDVLYEPSIMYRKVIEHVIVDIHLERYISGWKTIIVTESYLGKQNKFVSDITHWCHTQEEASRILIGKINSLIWGKIEEK